MELAGLNIPAEFREPNRAAHQSFSRAAASQTQPEVASRLADDAIRYACQAAEILTRSYATQALAGRLQRFGTLPVSIGCVSWEGEIPSAEGTVLFNEMFNSATVSIPWTSIEAVEGEYNWDATDRQIDW